MNYDEVESCAEREMPQRVLWCYEKLDKYTVIFSSDIGMSQHKLLPSVLQPAMQQLLLPLNCLTATFQWEIVDVCANEHPMIRTLNLIHNFHAVKAYHTEKWIYDSLTF